MNGETGFNKLLSEFISHDKSQPQTGFVLLGLLSMAQTRLEPVTFLSESTTLSIQPLSSSFIMRNSYKKRKPVNLAVKLLS